MNLWIFTSPSSLAHSTNGDIWTTIAPNFAVELMVVLWRQNPAQPQDVLFCGDVRPPLMNFPGSLGPRKSQETPFLHGEYYRPGLGNISGQPDLIRHC